MKSFKIILLLSLFPLMETVAQQDALYSQYMFNPMAINPAYTGTRNAISGILLHRSQWVGIDGAPRTNSLAIHSPVKGKNFGLGVNLLQDRIGPTTNTTLLGTYAYHLKLGQGKLSFGLRGGFYTNTLRNDELSYTNNTGKPIENFTSQTANFDFGTYYHTDNFYAGFSANHLTNGSVQFNNQTESYDLNLHLMGFVGKAFVLTPNLVVKPSALVRYTKAAPVNVDINTSVLFQKVFWLGASYRTSSSQNRESSIVLITEYNISQAFRIGYSYDFNLGAIKQFNSGSHEVFLGADLVSKRKKSVSPRYL